MFVGDLNLPVFSLGKIQSIAVVKDNLWFTGSCGTVVERQAEIGISLGGGDIAGAGSRLE